MHASVLGPLRLFVGGEERAAPGGQVGGLVTVVLPLALFWAMLGIWLGRAQQRRAAEAVARRRLRVTLSRLRQLLADGAVEEPGSVGLWIERQAEAYVLVASARSLDRVHFD